MKKYIVKENEEKQVIVRDSGKYVVELIGRGARVEVLGALEAAGNKKIVVDVTMVHKAPETSGEALLRAVVSNKAKIVLQGLVKVEKGAQKTNSFLLQKALLLSSKAEAEAVPMLEIKADDVKCSHAATVGTIDEAELFYLMSRGISRLKAERMIVEGFLSEIKRRINKAYG